MRLLNDDEKKKEIESLEIEEGCGNDLQMDLKLCDFPNLKQLLIIANSLRSIHSLTISNNPQLVYIYIGDSYMDIVSALENVKQIEISSTKLYYFSIS